MDKRTRVPGEVPLKTVVMETPPKMTVILEDAAELQAPKSDCRELGVTRMPPELETEESTSLFVRRPPEEVSKAPQSLLATRMAHSPAAGLAMKPTHRPAVSGPNVRLRIRTQTVRANMERIVKPAILCAVVMVLVVLVFAFRSESTADTAETKDTPEESVQAQESALSASSEKEAAKESVEASRVEEPSKKPFHKVLIAKPQNEIVAPVSEASVPPNPEVSEAKAATLLLAGRQSEALAVYRRLIEAGNPSEGVMAMVIVLEQKVGTP